MRFDKLGGAIEMKKSRRRFSSEFKLEAAQLVVNQGYAVREAADVINGGITMQERILLVISKCSTTVAELIHIWTILVRMNMKVFSLRCYKQHNPFRCLYFH